MQTQTIDTNPEIEKVQIALFRQATTVERLKRVWSLSETVIKLSRRAIARANPDLSQSELDLIFIETHYGKNTAPPLISTAKENMMRKSDILLTLPPVVDVFEELEIDYYIGGSIASSAYGIARATLDIDLVADIPLAQVQKLVENLQPMFYLDEEMIVDAIRRSSSFNMIHFETMTKIDVFIPQTTPYDSTAFQRRQKDTLDEDDQTVFYLASAEDTILHKLIWYRMGDRISERQWFDVLGVLKVQGDGLDMDYLHYWAKELKLTDLWNEAIREAT